MTFLNGVLVFGTAALAIPLLIHLLNRSRFRTVPWGAMHLLEAVVRTNNRRLRLEQLILLLIRSAIPALLALCLARPVLTGWQALAGAAPNSVVILLDNSYSMDAVARDGTQFATAQDSATAILESLPRGSDVSVLSTGGGPAPLLESPTFDTGKLLGQLRSLPGGYGPSPAGESLQAALDVVSRMSNARREVIVLSDFQRTDWESQTESSLRQLRERREGMAVVPRLTLLPIGNEVSDNVAVDGLTWASDLVGAGQDVRMRVHLRNYGQRSWPGAKVTLAVDGRARDVSQLTLGPAAMAQTLFTFQFQQPGAHTVEVNLDVNDSLPTDNRYRAAFSVVDKIPVVLVDGAPSSQPLEGETDFLAVALTPFSLGRVKLSDLLETKVLAPGQWKADSIGAARVVVLANVPQLDDQQVAWLVQHVRSGAGLLVFCGDRVNADWYNRILCSGPECLLPVGLGPVMGRGKPQSVPSRILTQRYDDPALAIFNDPTNGNLADAEIWNWCRFTSSPSDEVHVLARLENSDPLIVQRRVGEGVVVLVATACDADWSNLPMRPFYLPLMQQLVTGLAFQVTPSCNIHTNQPLVAVVPGDQQGQPLSLQLPDGTRRTVRPRLRETRAVVEFQDTGQPGIYSLTGGGDGPHQVAAEPARTESDVRRLDNPQLLALAESLGAEVVGSSQEYLRGEQTRRYGREVWIALLLTVLGLMFLELVLQQRFARVPT